MCYFSVDINPIIPSEMTRPKVNIARCVQDCTCVKPIRLVISDVIRVVVSSALRIVLCFKS